MTEEDTPPRVAEKQVGEHVCPLNQSEVRGVGQRVVTRVCVCAGRSSPPSLPPDSRAPHCAHALLKPPIMEDAVPPRVWASARPSPSQGLPPTGLVSEGVGGGQRGGTGPPWLPALGGGARRGPWSG